MTNIANLPIAHLANPHPVDLHSENLIEMVERGARELPKKKLLTFLDRKNEESHMTYADLLDGARVVAKYLRNRGLQRGDKVLVLLLTSEDFISAFFGTIMAGGVPVAASPPLSFGDLTKYLNNLRHIVRSSEARYLITFPKIKAVIGNVLGDRDNHLEQLILSAEITDEPALRPGLPSLDPDEPAFFQYTSGSTGLPKGVMLTHRALLSNVYGITHGIGASADDVSVSWLPMFHDMGLIGSLFTALYTGAHLITMLPESFVMHPIRWLENITRYRATVATAPNFAYHLCSSRIRDDQLQALDLSSLRAALNGAEPIDLRTLDVFERTFRPVGLRETVVFPVYGMAENCLAATFPTVGQRFKSLLADRERLEVDGVYQPARAGDTHAYHAVSTGSPIAGQELAIKSAEGGFAREGVVGEILVGGPCLMQGYYKNEAETERAIHHGWLRTGDLGFIQDGRLYITGRAKEMIIKRGRNYYPYDIERAASNVPGVRKGCLAAFAVPSATSGTEDLVVVAESATTDPARKRKIERRIRAAVIGDIGIAPDRISLVPPRTIPKTSSGKLQRILCRQRFLDGTLVEGASQRLVQKARTLVGSFIGHQRFRLRRARG